MTIQFMIIQFMIKLKRIMIRQLTQESKNTGRTGTVGRTKALRRPGGVLTLRAPR